jgi:nucleotide-binding universal stress UspA family protein
MTMKELQTAQKAENCTGNCSGCGKTHIKIFGAHDTAAQLLRARVMLALEASTMDAKVLEVSEPVAIQTSGVRGLPALMVEGVVLTEGVVPSVPEIMDLLKHQDLFKSKLFRLSTVSVPVDMSPVSGNALRFAWQVAKQLGANMEVVFAMDSIFEGATPSPSGFLSGYQTTMKTELDVFITEALAEAGVTYTPPSKFAGSPGTSANHSTTPFISSKVIYGAPDLALIEYSKQADMIVMGTTGRGNIGKKFFGSVSIEVSKNGHCPVIFVPKEAEYRGFNQVLYASDFDSLHALSIRQAASFAKRFDGQIHFVHVGPGGEQGLETQRRIFEIDYGSANPDRPFIFSKMVSDDIAGALYEYSFYHHIDLLVFVTHQRNFWDNILHKSISNVALLSSDLPVLIIHADDDLLSSEP